MGDVWRADPSAALRRRLGKSAHALGATTGEGSCPDIWELDNGDVAIIGQDMTSSYLARLPEGVSIDPGERLVVIPRITAVAARPDFPDA
jgi:hypothetical protein